MRIPERPQKRLFLTGAFNLNMLFREPQQVTLQPLSLGQARELAKEADSAIRHPGIAAILGERLGIEVPICYSKIMLDCDCRILVGWYAGPWVAPETTTCPEDGRVSWWLVSRQDPEEAGNGKK